MRRSPQLARLPRSETAGPPPPQRVKLRRTVHRRAKDPFPQVFAQLTVPAAFDELLPDGAVFEVSTDPQCTELRYRLAAQGIGPS